MVRLSGQRNQKKTILNGTSYRIPSSRRLLFECVLNKILFVYLSRVSPLQILRCLCNFMFHSLCNIFFVQFPMEQPASLKVFTWLETCFARAKWNDFFCVFLLCPWVKHLNIYFYSNVNEKRNWFEKMFKFYRSHFYTKNC